MKKLMCGELKELAYGLQLVSRVQSAECLVLIRSKSLTISHGATSLPVCLPSPGCELLEERDYTLFSFCFCIFTFSLES